MNASDTLARANHLVVGDSPSGVLLAAALLRYAPPDCRLEFVRPGDIPFRNVESWSPHRNVVLVDVPLDANDLEPTANFFKNIIKGGHQLTGVLAGRQCQSWRQCLVRADIRPESLAIVPDPNDDLPTAKVLMRRPLTRRDQKDRDLCSAAVSAETGEPKDELAALVKRIFDSSDDRERRTYLAWRISRSPHLLSLERRIATWHLDAQVQALADSRPDEAARLRREHEQRFRAVDAAIANREDLGDRIFRIRFTDQVMETLDIMCLLGSLETLPIDIVLLDNPVTRVVRFQSVRNMVRVDELLEKEGVKIGGCMYAADVRREDEELALVRVRAEVLRSKRELTLEKSLLANIDLSSPLTE